jgi:hypothetical protein
MWLRAGTSDRLLQATVANVKANFGGVYLNGVLVFEF